MKTLITTIAMLIAAANLSAAEPLDTLWTMKTNLFGYAGAKFVHNDTKILIAYNSRIYEIDALTGDTIRIFPQISTINNFSTADNPTKIIIGNGNGIAELVNYESMELIKTFSGNSAVAIRNDELFSAISSSIILEDDSKKRGIKVFNMVTLDSVNFIETRIGQYEAGVHKLQFSPDGRFLLAVLRNYEDNPFTVVRVFNGNTFEFIKDIIFEQIELGNSELNFSQDGSMLCVTIFFNINLFNTETWEKVSEINPSMTKYPRITRGFILKDNKKIVVGVGGQDPGTQIWEVNPLKLKNEFQTMGTIAVSSNNKFFLSTFNTLFLTNLENYTSIFSNPLPPSLNLFYNDGFSLSSTQEIISSPMIEVFNFNGGIVLPLSPMLPISGIYKNNTPIPNGLYFVKLHVNNNIYTTKIIVE